MWGGIGKEWKREKEKKEEDELKRNDENEKNDEEEDKMENNKEMREKGKEGNGTEEKKMTIMLATVATAAAVVVLYEYL